MRRPRLEVADIFRDHGAAWRAANAGHLSLGQLKVMNAIERCRTAALGGHIPVCRSEAPKIRHDGPTFAAMRLQAGKSRLARTAVIA